MRFSVQHSTRYTYTAPVSLGDHVLRLVPQRRSSSVLSHDLRISPPPVSLDRRIDEYGNDVVHVSFSGQTSELLIESRFEAETQPLGKLEDPGWPGLPWLASPSPGAGLEGEVVEFAHALAASAGYRPLEFLQRLTETLFQRVDRHIRPEGPAQAASETLASMRGACRDITVLFLETCRALGIRGRFVSGYQATADTPDGQRHLHAWPEVHLPDAGWRGWDPTHGTSVSDGHIALCAAPTQAETMPVQGGFSFAGPAITSNLTYSVRIHTSA